MPIWDIIGPVMIGPSSSHTAGAVRLGRMIRLCWGDNVTKVDIYMRGSFAATGRGHGTDRALLAGLLGCAVDSPLVRDGIAMAKASGIEYAFHTEDIDGAHPNSARFVLSGGGRTMEAVGASVGGGAVELFELDGFKIGISGQLPTIIVINRDVSGVVGAVASYLSSHDINIAAMRLNRSGSGGFAVMALEVDRAGRQATMDGLKRVHSAIVRTMFIPRID